MLRICCTRIVNIQSSELLSMSESQPKLKCKQILIKLVNYSFLVISIVAPIMYSLNKKCQSINLLYCRVIVAQSISR